MKEKAKLFSPPLSPNTPAKNLKEVFKTIKDSLGNKGKAAMKKYVSNSGLQEGSAAMELLRELFKGTPKGATEEQASATPCQQH